MKTITENNKQIVETPKRKVGRPKKEEKEKEKNKKSAQRMLKFLGGNSDDSNGKNLGAEGQKKTNKVTHSPLKERNNNGDIKGAEKIQDNVPLLKNTEKKEGNEKIEKTTLDRKIEETTGTQMTDDTEKIEKVIQQKECRCEEKFRKIIDELWVNKMQPKLIEMSDNIKNLQVAKDNEEERELRNVAALTAASRAREREIGCAIELKQLTEKISDLEKKIQDSKRGREEFNLDHYNKNRELQDKNRSLDRLDEQNEEISSIHTQEENGRIDDQSMTRQPELLTKNEIKWEMDERQKRKNSIVVRGFRSRGKDLRREIVETLHEYTGVKIEIRNMTQIAGGALIKLDSWFTKRKLMQNKFKLRGTAIRIEDDITNREKEVQSWIEEQVKNGNDRGEQASLKYMRWIIGEKEFVWNEENGPKELQFFRRM
ncbi:uncharacterized protein PFB0145c-like [Leptopilina heterotoma]|uniref:uncharacterized protein PFB0145c-like n=1 Tax=Leptopilina heterotoma TaxID=63436 RepID=UPI001CA8169C|nr:uncharacterized protein PFB0145c-like [Leptopilina heterotoma]